MFSRRPTRAELSFWVLVAVIAVAFLLWIHHRDSSHDQWDWSDWLEATFASACGGFVVTGALWLGVATLIRRLPHRLRASRRSWLPPPR